MDVKQVLAAAERLYRAHVLPTLAGSLAAVTEVGLPAAVRQYQGAGRFWYVPLRARGREVGFAHLSEGLELDRYGTWTDDPAEAAALAPSLLEMSPQSVTEMALAKAREETGPGVEPQGPPELVYLVAPTRIAWACRVRLPDGRQETVFVTPEYTWLEEPEGGELE